MDGSAEFYFPGFLSRKKAINSFGLDFSKEALLIAKKETKRNIFVNGDLTNLPFGNGSFDAIFTADVMEHLDLEQTKETFLEFSRILKKRGFLVIHTPNLPFGVHLKKIFFSFFLGRDYKWIPESDLTHVGVKSPILLLRKLKKDYSVEKVVFYEIHKFNLLAKLKLDFILRKLALDKWFFSGRYSLILRKK